MTRTTTLVFLAMIFSILHSGAPTEAATLKKGDRIVFLGDSITAAGVQPNGYVTLVREAIDAKHKDLGVKVFGAGISGHKVPDLQKRLDRDVLSKKPTVVVIYIGINDVWHSTRGRGTSKKDFSDGLHDLIKRINNVGARVILCTPSVIGEKADGSNDLDTMLDEYSAISRKVAVDTKSQLLDLRKAFIADLKTSNPEAKKRGILTSDGVHLNKKGNRFVADQMLAALSLEAKMAVVPQGKALRHVVLFSFKKEATENEIKTIITAFGELKNKIGAIKGYEWGTDVSTENLANGFTHCFVVTFHSAKDRDSYLPHPAHKEFVKLLGPHLEKVLVVDFWAQE